MRARTSSVLAHSLHFALRGRIQLTDSDHVVGFRTIFKKNKLQKCLPFGIRPPASPQCCGVAPGLRSPHSTSRDCPDAFPGVCGHHRGCGALNPPRTKGDILPNPRFHRSRSQFWQNVTFCPRWIHCPTPPVVAAYPRKCFGVVPRGAVRATQARCYPTPLWGGWRPDLKR